MLGSDLKQRLSFYSTFKNILISVAFGIALVGAISSQPAYAAAVYTEKPIYLPGENAVISGVTFLANETVTLRITEKNGTLLPDAGSLPWDVPASSVGNFNTQWAVIWAYAGDTLLVSAVGKTSGAVATTTFLAPKSDMNQLQNGTSTVAPQWSNGNINTSNACYAEGRSVAYRYFVEGLSGGSKHYFTIEMEWTKGGVHALDYLTDYDATESAAIALTGGPCGTISTTPPAGCSTPAATFAFPNFLNTANYSGSIPSDFFTTVNPGFVLDGPRNLSAYNVTIDSLSKYSFGGTSSDRSFSVVVYFTVQNAGSVGFFWGGHLAEGATDAWGVGNGSASVSGAPYHMTAMGFDGAGGGGANRSIQNGNICLPPNAGILCGSSSVCNTGSNTYVCRDTASAATGWTWTVINGTIIGSNTLDSVVYSVNPGLNSGDYVYVKVQSCDGVAGCAGTSCCAIDSVAIPVVDCNNPPVVSCANDTTILLCNLASVCIPNFVCSDPDNNLTSCQVSLGTLTGTTVCFTPTGAGVYPIRLIGTDSYGLADTCTTNVTIVLNVAPVAACPGNQTKSVCDLSPITIDGFNCTDPNGNLASCAVSKGILNGTQVTFTPVAGPNVITLTATDACGLTSTCQTTVTVNLNSAPVATCPGNQTKAVCNLSPITISGFSCSDVDNNLTSCTVDKGTLSGNAVTFTPVVGANVITLTATDACGRTSTCQTTVTVNLNNAPGATCPGNQTKSVCSLSPITIDGFSCTDPDGNLASCAVNKGTLNGTQVTFTPVAGANVITLTATDACGLTSTCQTTVTVNLNNAPVATCPGNQAKFVCSLSPITIDGFSCTDPDGNLASCAVDKGTLSGTQVTFTPVAGANVITLTATDVCGQTSTCQTTVTVTPNSAPVCNLPASATYFVCGDTTFSFPVSATDVNGNLTGCTKTSGPGTLTGGNWVFTTTGAGTYTANFSCADACGASCSGTTTITVNYNHAPVATCPGNQTKFVCNLSPITITGFSCSDVDNNLTLCAVNKGTLSGDAVTFTPVVGANVITLTATDACGRTSTCQTTVTVSLNSAPVATCPGDRSATFACQPSPIIVGPFSSSDADNNIVSESVSFGALSGGQVTFTPDTAGIYTITYTVTDACGVSGQCHTHVTVQYVNHAPVATCHGDTAMFVCNLAPITLGGFSCSDVDNNLKQCSATGGTLNGNQVTFTPVAGVNTITLTALDSCGQTSVCQTRVTVTLNQAPVATCPGVQTVFRCNLSDMTIGGFSCSDPNGNLVSCTVDKGTLNGNEVTFEPVTGLNIITLTATDACGAITTCQARITVVENEIPAVDMPDNDTLFLGTTQQFCYTIGVTDPDYPVYQSLPQGHLVDGAGTLTNNILCFTPTQGIDSLYWFIVEVCDSCGIPVGRAPGSPLNSCVTDSFFVLVRFNHPPVVNCPNNTSATFSCGPAEVCVDGFSATDPDNNIVSQTVSLGTLSGGRVCFMPDAAGVYTIIYTVTDALGATAQCETKVTVQYSNRPPTVTCHGDTTMNVCQLDQICLSGFSCSDPDNNLVSCAATGGTLNGNTVCFTPVAGVNTITLTATDACGQTASCVTRVTVNIISSPQITDTIRAVTMCAPGQKCVALPQVTGGQAPYTWRYKGQVVTGTEICFTLNDDSTVVGAITVTDNCGRTDAATMIVNAVVNTAPVISVTVTSPQFLCQPGAQICAKLTIFDPDNGLSGTSTIGTVRMADSTVCFAADTAGHYCNRVIISDACGLKDTASYCVDVVLNHAPVCNLPQSRSITQCQPTLVCLPVSATDQDGNLVGCQIVDGPGYLMNGNWCYTPTRSQSVTVKIRCTDQCGAFCEGSFTVNFNVDSPPVATCHEDTSFVMVNLHEICLSGFGCYDPDGNLASCTSNRGPITDGEICFMPTEGLNNVVVTAEDACGNIATCTTRVSVVIFRECPVVRIEKTEGSLQGHIVTVNVTIEDAGLFEIGGYDLLLGYESAGLTFVDAGPGDLLTDCGWEHFSYRYGPEGNCGNGCPSGMLRLIAMAETNNGPNHPDCFGPTDLAVHGLAKLQFMVTNDRTFECQYLPVYFTWLNCGDNGFSNIDGDSLIIDSKIFDFEGNIIWDETDDIGYREEDRLPFMGADDSCLIGFKYSPYRCLELWNGGVDVVCADSIDARGDINLNGIANEVADAVLLTNYFVAGLEAFTNPEGSIAASDVNSDGIALSVADLVYLIRVIVGDAAPYAKPIPNSTLTVTTQATADGLAVTYEASNNIGAVLLTFAISGSGGQPILGPGASGMDILSGINGNELRVLVYNIGSQSIAAGSNTLMIIPGDGEITLTGVEAADYYGGVMPVSTRALPTSFELAQNYPNPFNPTTTIKLSLGAASEWSVSIYNIAGQKVRDYSGFSEPGMVTVTWDGMDANGNGLSSGIYLYRATAGNFSETRKMVLMK